MEKKILSQSREGREVKCNKIIGIVKGLPEENETLGVLGDLARKVETSHKRKAKLS